MPRYTVENTQTEESSSHSTWSAAFKAADKLAKGEPHNVRIIESDRDGEREYNIEGKQLRRDGHYR